jgi:hypothetical protein
MQVYGRALSAAEVYALAQRQVAGITKAQVWLEPVDLVDTLAGSAASYAFEEADGSQSFGDSSGNGHDATCTVCPGSGSGIVGRALVFTGTGMLDANAALVDLSQADFTLGAWIKTSAASQGIMTKNNGDQSWEGGEKAFFLDASGRPAFAGAGNGVIRSTLAVNDGAWHHVAVAWKHVGGTYVITVDGVDVTDRATSAYAPDLIDNPGDTFKIGAASYETESAPVAFNGMIDEVAIYDRALAASDVGELAARPDDSVWQNASLSQAGSGLAGWSYAIPNGLEDFYQINVRGVDAGGQAAVGVDDAAGGARLGQAGRVEEHIADAPAVLGLGGRAAAQ